MKVFGYRPTDASVDCSAVIITADGEVLGSWCSSDRYHAVIDTKRFVPEGAEVEWLYGQAQLLEAVADGRLKRPAKAF